MSTVPKHIAALAKTIAAASPIKKSRIEFGEVSLKVTKIDVPKSDVPKYQLLAGAHEYLVQLADTSVRISIQLFLNPRGHYRLFAFAPSGMLFSVNFTTTEDAAGVISLSQGIKFGEGRSLDPTAATAIRQAKARMLADMLTRIGFTVTDNMEVEFGTFCSKRQDFLDTTADHFLQSFIAVALLKGHFQGNKGFQFGCMPRFDDTFQWKWSSTEKVRASFVPNKAGRNGQREIPLGLRFQVLERDGAKCVVCGSSPAKNGTTLHVDHINPYSLGGMTVLDNLQTMCSVCNLGKGNRSKIRYLEAPLAA